MVKQTIKGMLGIPLLIFVCFVWGPSPIMADPPQPAGHVAISEVSPASPNSASQEFVEIYNPVDQPVIIDDWHLEYKSATGTTWTLKATLNGNIEPRGFYLL